MLLIAKHFAHSKNFKQHNNIEGLGNSTPKQIFLEKIAFPKTPAAENVEIILLKVTEAFCVRIPENMTM